MTIPWLRLSARVAHFLGVALPEGTDFEVGVEAWGRGDSDTALQEFPPLAEKGDYQGTIQDADQGIGILVRPGYAGRRGMEVAMTS